MKPWRNSRYESDGEHENGGANVKLKVDPEKKDSETLFEVKLRSEV